MPRRSLLSAEQRARLFDVPTMPAEMATHYVLSSVDLLLVRAKRRTTNRLGFAVQLCLLRYPGQGLGPGQQLPVAMLEFVAGQLSIPTSAFPIMPGGIKRGGSTRSSCTLSSACAASD